MKCEYVQTDYDVYRGPLGVVVYDREYRFKIFFVDLSKRIVVSCGNIIAYSTDNRRFEEYVSIFRVEE
jgi:hypothetical protein